MSNEKEYSFIRRFWIYQKERFPLIGNGVMIAAFTFSAIAYSRICRGVEGFIPWQDYLIGVFATVTLFLLVRIFDEFKDKEDDAKYRKYLPVPRGLISLKALRNIGIIVGVLQLAVLAIFQLDMLWLYAIVIGYLLLMGVEFFIPKWLKKHHLIYITSHMVIIPLVDIYASGLDWLLDGDAPHYGLLWFFAVSYCNGLSLEFGRKLRAPGHEEEGVTSYTKLYGPKGGVYAWLGLLALTMALAMGASWYAGLGTLAYVLLAGFFVLCTIPGFLFLKAPSPKKSKWMEYSAALWTALMYLTLGAVPMLYALINS